MEDANCGKLHTKMPTTRFFVVGENGGLADVVVSLQGISGKSTGASAPPVVLDQKGCEYIPSFLPFSRPEDHRQNSDPVLHNVHTVPAEGSANKERNEAQLPKAADLTFLLFQARGFPQVQMRRPPVDVRLGQRVRSSYFAVSGKDGRSRSPMSRRQIQDSGRSPQAAPKPKRSKSRTANPPRPISRWKPSKRAPMPFGRPAS